VLETCPRGCIGCCEQFSKFLANDLLKQAAAVALGEDNLLFAPFLEFLDPGPGEQKNWAKKYKTMSKSKTRNWDDSLLSKDNL
jgi:hypothetical protein